MSKHLYANLLGEWINLSNEDNVIIDNSYTDTSTWIEEKLPELFNFDYINIQVNDKHYRIHPSFIQIVTK